jgi:hypothetical protein
MVTVRGGIQFRREVQKREYGALDQEQTRPAEPELAARDRILPA